MVSSSSDVTPAPAAPRVASDLMDRNPPRVLPTALVGEVARLLLERHLSGVPVVAETGEFLGLVTQTDLVSRHAHVHFPFYLNVLGGVFPVAGEHRFQEEMRRITGQRATDVMTTEPYTAEEDTPLEDIATQMAEHRVDPVPVLRQDRLVGLITRADIVRLVVIEEGPTGS